MNQALAAERLIIAQTERENARKELAPELEAEKQQFLAVKKQLELSQKAELELRQKQDEMTEREKNLQLEIARQVDEKRKAIAEQAQKDADDRARLEIAARDKTISDMQVKLEEAQRKGSQGSQQLQGEVLELEFEEVLQRNFPQDTVEPVKTGARGGDLVQRVLGGMGRSAGTIFWEIKRTQSWGGDWAAKAKKDAADAKADVAIIVSEALPKGIEDFGPFEGVWAVRPVLAVMLATALRQGIITTSEARQGAFGKETKMELLYAYMIGPDFRATLEGIALPFRELWDELNSEKRTTMARWRRQEKRIERVLSSVAALQGDLQGIAGSEMPQLPDFREPEIEVEEI